jgi:polysaccharide pyruvyl transferase WcaK-like protein
MKQKLSIKARREKAKRDKAFAMTPSRKAKKAENQRLRRKAKKNGINLRGKDYDHTKKKFVSVKKNRGGYGKGTK